MTSEVKDIPAFNTHKTILHITICSQTSVPRTRIGRTLLMARTDLKVPSIFLIFLSKENPFRSNTDTSNSRTQ